MAAGPPKTPDLTPRLSAPYSRSALTSNHLTSKLVIIMVGLPAREKSFIVKKLARYLNWLQYETRVFNAGEHRRRAARNSVHGPRSGSSPQSSAAFFDPTDSLCVSRRDAIALGALDDLLNWIMGGSSSSSSSANVGILDATNSTRERRQLVLSRIRERAGQHLGVLFLESQCSDEAILEKNFQLKLSGPDYRNKDPGSALEDFKRRVTLYERAFVALGDDEEKAEIPYVQVIDVGRKMNTHLVSGFLPALVVEFMLGFNLTERQLWISCGGESLDDAKGRIGRASELNENGRRYADALARFIQRRQEAWGRQQRTETAASLGEDENGASRVAAENRRLHIWTSTMPQTILTASSFPDDLYDKTEMKMLDDLNAGDMAGLTFAEIAEQHTAVFDARKRHKLLYRWPGLGGEAYVDLIHRLKPVIVESERSRDHLLLISHRAVVRVLLAYFLDLQRNDLPWMVFPKNWVFLLEPANRYMYRPYGIDFHAFSSQYKDDDFREEQDPRRLFQTR